LALRALNAAAEPDAYTFEWDLKARDGTIASPYLGQWSSAYKLRYSDYLETMADDMNAGGTLVTVSSSDPITLATAGPSGVLLQSFKNNYNFMPTSLTATFCDGQRVDYPNAFANLVSSAPFDYDIGATTGNMIQPKGGQVCVPIRLYSESEVHQFHFTLRFDGAPESASATQAVLDCSSTSCGSWTPGTDWKTFGTAVSLSTDAGQVDFATVASVASFGKRGTLDMGTLCMNVLQAGELFLQVQSKVHIDSNGNRGCLSSPHLYESGTSSTRCFSRTPEVRLPVQRAGRRRQLSSEQLALIQAVPRQLQASQPARSRPFNIDRDANQLTMADCLFLGAKQQELSGFFAQTQSYLNTIDQALVPSYNPNFDVYHGTDTPVIDQADLTYCINYVMKRWRFVSDVSLSCANANDGVMGAKIRLSLAGGKVGSMDQAEYYVDAPALGTLASAILKVQCPSQSSSTITVPLRASGLTSPFEGTFSTPCPATLMGYSIYVRTTSGVYSTSFPWSGSSELVTTRLRGLSPQPASVTCTVQPPSSPSMDLLLPPLPLPPPPSPPVPPPPPAPPNPPPPPPPRNPPPPPSPLTPCIGQALSFSLEQGDILYNNLGGLGPSTDSRRGIRYVNVLTAPLEGRLTNFDLVVTNLTKYSSDTPANNGISGKTARINLACNSNTRFRVRVMLSCATLQNCKACDLLAPAEKSRCYELGCSCYAAICTSAPCCANSMKELHRQNYGCPNYECVPLNDSKATALHLLRADPQAPSNKFAFVSHVL
jgi:hypothetical protein